MYLSDRKLFNCTVRRSSLLITLYHVNSFTILFLSLFFNINGAGKFYSLSFPPPQKKNQNLLLYMCVIKIVICTSCATDVLVLTVLFQSVPVSPLYKRLISFQQGTKQDVFHTQKFLCENGYLTRGVSHKFLSAKLAQGF